MLWEFLCPASLIIVLLAVLGLQIYRNRYVRIHGQEYNAEIESVTSIRRAVIYVKFIYEGQETTARLDNLWGTSISNNGFKIFYHPRYPEIAVYKRQYLE